MKRTTIFKTGDSVNHPDHYNVHPSGVECIDVIEHFPHNIGAAIKYLWRAGLKGGASEDLAKAAWYSNREIARLEKFKPARRRVGSKRKRFRKGKR